MDFVNRVKDFYSRHLPGAQVEGDILKAPCPLCGREENGSGQPAFVVYLKHNSFFMGYFKCLNRCTPGGFFPYFARIMGIDLNEVPGYDAEREPYVEDIVYPAKNLNSEIRKFMSLIDKDKLEYFARFGISKAVIEEMKIGYNGRYLVYPYFLIDGNCYAARCILPGKEEDNFWYGDESFTREDFRIFNAPDLDRCEEGALFITEGENNLLILKELGYPGIAVPSAADLESLKQERFAYINHVFLAMSNTPEAQLAARSFATRLGFKARILKWPAHLKRGYNLLDLARDKGKDFGAAVSAKIKDSTSFSPFSSPQKEERILTDFLERERSKQMLGVSSGFDKFDQALSGLRGISIMGGPPKAGKSCFFIQISTEAARRKDPVIYYDFENGRQKIYTRTLSRLSRVTEQEIRREKPRGQEPAELEKAYQEFNQMLHYFRVVTERKLNPEIMRRQIDFLKHETRCDYVLVVIDSLHKLPFEDLSDRRTGIDGWLRHMEAIRDEQNVSFLVVSELSRGVGGRYSDKPDLGSFKESGDIEYSADNAMIFLPDWDALDPLSTDQRKSTLWLAASRESSPGKIAEYILDYPYWGFKEL